MTVLINNGSPTLRAGVKDQLRRVKLRNDVLDLNLGSNLVPIAGLKDRIIAGNFRRDDARQLHNLRSYVDLRNRRSVRRQGLYLMLDRRLDRRHRRAYRHRCGRHWRGKVELRGLDRRLHGRRSADHRGRGRRFDNRGLPNRRLLLRLSRRDGRLDSRSLTLEHHAQHPWNRGNMVRVHTGGHR